MLVSAHLERWEEGREAREVAAREDAARETSAKVDRCIFNIFPVARNISCKSRPKNDSSLFAGPKELELLVRKCSWETHLHSCSSSSSFCLKYVVADDIQY